MPKKALQETGVESFKLHDQDTGSVEVQIGILTDEIVELQAHLVSHKKDFDAKRSLLKKVARRRALLKYLKSKKLAMYNKISQAVSVKV